MRRLGRWLLTVLVLAVAGALLGHRFGTTLRVIVFDYVVVASDYGELGMRLGVLAGTILGAAQVVGARPLPRLRTLVLALGVLGVVAVAGLAAGGWGSVALFEAGRLGGTWELPNPRRYALFLGLDRAARIGPILGALAGAALLWRARPDEHRGAPGTTAERTAERSADTAP